MSYPENNRTSFTFLFILVSGECRTCKYQVNHKHQQIQLHSQNQLKTQFETFCLPERKCHNNGNHELPLRVIIKNEIFNRIASPFEHQEASIKSKASPLSSNKTKQFLVHLELLPCFLKDLLCYYGSIAISSFDLQVGFLIKCSSSQSISNEVIKANGNCRFRLRSIYQPLFIKEVKQIAVW